VSDGREMNVSRSERVRDSWAVIVALGLTQIIGYGSVFYSFSLLMEPLQQALGATKSVVVGAFSVALLIAGLCATLVGSTIDRIGGRMVMALGSAGAAILLASLSRVESVFALYAIYAGPGATMAAILYEPAFAVLTQIFGSNYRRAITALTLFGGFASTVFWPLTQQLIVHFGWRGALLVLAGLNILLCVPLHLMLLPGRGLHAESSPVARSKAKASKSLREVLRERTFYWLCGAFVANGLIFSAMSVHMMPMLKAKGLSAAAAAAIGALVGPMQVTGRILELTTGQRFSIVRIGLLAVSLVPVALLVFATAEARYWPLVVFALLYGLSNGVITIVRGTLPAELFGRDHYGAVSGALAVPGMISLASGPFLASLLWMAMGGS
jgi:MFS family permease